MGLVFHDDGICWLLFTTQIEKMPQLTSDGDGKHKFTL
jgi:hypothetical protein